jgi:hypothetical protein
MFLSSLNSDEIGRHWSTQPSSSSESINVKAQAVLTEVRKLRRNGKVGGLRVEKIDVSVGSVACRWAWLAVSYTSCSGHRGRGLREVDVLSHPMQIRDAHVVTRNVEINHEEDGFCAA